MIPNVRDMSYFIEQALRNDRIITKIDNFSCQKYKNVFINFIENLEEKTLFSLGSAGKNNFVGFSFDGFF